MNSSTDDKKQSNLDRYISSIKENLDKNGYFGKNGKAAIALDSFAAGTTIFYTLLSNTADAAINRKISYIGTVVPTTVSFFTAFGSNPIACNLSGIVTGTIIGSAVGTTTAAAITPLGAASLGFYLGSEVEKLTVAMCETIVAELKNSDEISANKISEKTNQIKTIASQNFELSKSTETSTNDTLNYAHSILSFRASPDYIGSDGAFEVSKGQTLSGIAKENQISVADLLAANPQIKDPNSLRIGQKLRLPSNATNYQPGEVSGAAIPDPNAQADSLASVLYSAAGTKVTVVTEHSGRVAVISSESNSVSLIENDGSIVAMPLKIYSQRVEALYEDYIASGGNNTTVFFKDTQTGVSGNFEPETNSVFFQFPDEVVYSDSNRNLLVFNSVDSSFFFSDTKSNQLIFSENNQFNHTNKTEFIKFLDDGSSEENLQIRSIDGSLISKKITTRALDGDIFTSEFDKNGLLFTTEISVIDFHTQKTIRSSPDGEIFETIVEKSISTNDGKELVLRSTTDNTNNQISLAVLNHDGEILAQHSSHNVTADELNSQNSDDRLHFDVADFLTALRQKNTAGIILSTARIALDYARHQGMVTGQLDKFIGDASGAIALINSINSIENGDTLAQIGGTVGLLNSTNYFYGRAFDSSLLSAPQAKFLGTVGALLSIATLTKLDDMLEAGQIGSAVATVTSAINAIGYLSSGSALMGSGAIIAINPIAMVVGAFVLDSVFGDDPPPPPPTGTARFMRESDGRLGYQISNANSLGHSILKKQMDLLLPKMQAQIATANEHIADNSHQLQLIASRMPVIHISSWPSYSENGVSNYFFAIEQADPKRDDPNWMGIARQDLVENYGHTLLLPEALVQQWEVDHLRAKFGSDEAHWQTESAWLRAQSPVEKERSRLQAAYDQAAQEWKAVSAAKLVASSINGTSANKGNVTLLPTLAERREAARKAMAAAEVVVDTYNVTYPADPALAARATEAEEAAFARSHAAKETVALQWTRLIAIDIGNDGISISDLPGHVGSDLDSLQHQQVARFDVDGDGFREATQWVAPTEAILGIDRSGNGVLDDGSELFNAADTPFDQHGLPSLAYFDANSDGLINRDDPAFRQLRLWVDLDGDGSSGAVEVFDMDMHPVGLPGKTDPAAPRSPMAIESIDLRNHKVIYADGGTSGVETVSLLSHVKGLQVVHDEETKNLNVFHEDGLRENFITLVDDMGALAELQSGAISASRRAELVTLAKRYGLNPDAKEFSSIVQSLRASASDAGQDTVIYFGDDDVWVDPSIRERLAQIRISFRKLSDTTQSISGDSQLARLGAPLEAEPLTTPGNFDDRWVQSRKVLATEVQSDAALTPDSSTSTLEQLILPQDVYSLLEVTKGAQDGGMVTQQVVPASDPARPGLLPKTVSVFVTQQPVASLPAIALGASEDATISLSYTQLEQQALSQSTARIGRLQLLGVRSSEHGSASMDDTHARLSFEPDANYNGDASLTVVLADSQGLVYEQRLNIRLAPVNDAPLVSGERIFSAEDVPLLIDCATLLANDTDPEGDPIAITGIGRVALGKAELLGNGQIHYTPPSDQYDVTDTVEYFVSDRSGATSIGKIRIGLAGVEDAPSVVSERVINAREDQVLRIGTKLLLANDFDVDTDARVGADVLHISAVGSADHGDVRLEGEQILFQPERDYNGAAAFSYTVTDATGRSTTGRTLLRIDAVSDAPLVADEHIDTREDEPLIIDTALLLQNDIDPDILRGEKQSLAIVAVDQADGGTVQLRDGQVLFTPDANHFGAAGFRYTVSDGAGGFGQGKVDIALAAVNDAPVVLPQHFKTDEDQALSVTFASLLSGATDVDDDPAQLRFAGMGKVTGGSVSLKDDKLIFTPDKDYFGAAMVEYRVADAQGLATTGTFTVDINSVNDAPVALDGVRLQPVADEDQEVRISESALLKLFVDVDGDPMRLLPDSVKALDSGDRASYDAERHEVVFRGAQNANGDRHLSFAVSDGTVASQPLSMSVQLRPLNDAPVVHTIGFQMLEDGGETNPSKSAWTYLSYDKLLSGASDVDGDVLSVVSVGNGHTSGSTTPQSVQTVNDVENRRVGLMAPLNCTGAIEFEFTVSDGHGGVVTQKALGAISPVNDAPLFTSKQLASTYFSVMGSNRITYKWQLSAWDPDENLPLKFAVINNPLHSSPTTKILSNRAAVSGGMQMEVAVSVESFTNGNYTAQDSAEFSATDSVGSKSTTTISYKVWYGDPIVIDLNNDGLKFVDIDHSQVSFDIDGSGEKRRIAWVNGDDAILAYDVDRDGQISRMNEISLWSHVSNPIPGRSDLQALQQIEFDSNQDGIFDAADAKWEQFKLWRDLNGNGKSDDGELQTMQQAHIKQLYLNGNVLNRAEGPDVLVRGYTRAVTDDGRLLQAADVWLNTDDGSAPVTPPPIEPRQASLLNPDQLASLLSQLANTPTGSNHAPLLYGYLPTQYADEDEFFRLDVSPNLFIDPDPNEALQFSATLADGSELPAWLRFDASQLRFEGKPSSTDAAELQVVLRATDPSKATNETWFNLVVSPANHAPSLAAPMPPVVWVPDTDYRFTLPSTLFRDTDVNEQLAIDVTRADGQPLPEWLSYDPVSLTLSGKATAEQLAAPLALRVTATDLQGAQATAYTHLGLTPEAGAGAGASAAVPAAVSVDSIPLQNVIQPVDALIGQSSAMSALSDLISGTSGDDEYRLSPGDGWHSLLDPDGSDLIRIDAPIMESGLRFGRHGDDLQLSVSGTNDGMTISGWYHTNSAGVAVNQIERFQLADGKTLQSADVDKLIAAQSQGATAQAGQYWR